MQIRKYSYELDEQDLRSGLVTDLFSSVLELEKRCNIGEFEIKNKITGNLKKYKLPFFKFIDIENIEHTQFIMLPEINIENLKTLDLSGLEFKFLDQSNIDKIIMCGYECKSVEIRKCFFYNRILLLERLGKDRYLKSFIKNYDCKVLLQYDFDRVLELFDIWNTSLKQEGRRGKADKADFVTFFQKENIEKYSIKILYFEIDNKLMGVRIVFPFTIDSNLLILRHKIGIFDHRGFDIFMNYKTAEIFDQYQEFSDGGDFTLPEFASRMKYKLEKWQPDRITSLFVVKVM